MPNSLKKKTYALELVNILNQFSPLSEGAKTFLLSSVQFLKVGKGNLLLKADTVCQKFYFIAKGLVRGFVLQNEKEITTWINCEGEIVSSISGLTNQIPSFENIQTLEDCELLVLEVSDLDRLYKEHPEFNTTGRILLQRYYADADSRAILARLSNAEAKYKYFLMSTPHLANRAKLKYIASYLGIKQETLSRIRKKLSQNKK